MMESNKILQQLELSKYYALANEWTLKQRRNNAWDIPCRINSFTPMDADMSPFIL